MRRIIIATLGLAGGVALGLALDDALHAWEPPTFAERWGPVDAMPAMLDVSTPFPSAPPVKSDRGPCINRRPRCKLA